MRLERSDRWGTFTLTAKAALMGFVTKAPGISVPGVFV